MILHALRILRKSLNDHLNGVAAANDDNVVIGNIAFDDASDYKPKDNQNIIDTIALTLVKIEEESTLKNTPAYIRNPATNKIEYQNPPVFVNLYILVSVNSKFYENAITYLSRIIRFFQHNRIFTHKDSEPDVAVNDYDKMENFRLLIDMYSPSFEEINHFWSVLGGKQLPSVMYKLRVMDLKFQQPTEVRGVIEQIDINSTSDQLNP